MKGVLAAYCDDKRRVFVADSFAGLPPPDPQNFPSMRPLLRANFTPLPNFEYRAPLLTTISAALDYWIKGLFSFDQ
jgi:hypothetical protein